MRSAVETLWNEPKRQANLAKHDFDFADLDPGFSDGPVVVTVKDGQPAAVGPFLGPVIFTAYVELGTKVVALIILRRVDRRKRITYAQAI
jgi:uncharacterized DUF497 family protein